MSYSKTLPKHLLRATVKMRQEASTEIVGLRNENRNWNVSKRKRILKNSVTTSEFRPKYSENMTPCGLTVVLLVADTSKQARPVSLSRKNCSQPNTRIRDLQAPAAYLSTWTWFMNILLHCFCIKHWTQIPIYMYIHMYSLSKNINFNYYWHYSEIFCVVFTIQCSQC